EIQYQRNDTDFHRGTFRVRGDVVEIFPASSEDQSLRIELFGDQVDAIHEIDPLTGKSLRRLSKVAVYPNTHYLIPPDRFDRALSGIEAELDERIASFKRNGQLLEAQRLEQRTRFDLEMIRAMGYYHVIEQIVRPTGLMDPAISVRPAKGQVDDLLGEIKDRVSRGDRVLVTTLTKRMAEDLTEYYHDLGVRVRYLHSDIDTLERTEII